MIISRTPLRISFVGGGSDIESYYSFKNGAVVSSAINRYIYIAVSHQFDGRIIINYSQTEIVKKVGDIRNNLVREALKLTGIKEGIHIASISDIPSEGSGMGSSSAYIVGLLNALYAYQGKHVNAKRLAADACHIEIDILKKPVGKQDQYIASYGGFQYIQFNSDGNVFVDPIICLLETKKSIQDNLLLFYTGITRLSDPILTKQTQRMSQVATRNIMTKMVALADTMQKKLNKNDIKLFGKMLHQNWILKTKMAEGITTPQINKWYNLARKNGAIGGKILGAGGGGFLLIYAEVKNHQKIIRALHELLPVDVVFEPQGSKIIFVGD